MKGLAILIMASACLWGLTPKAKAQMDFSLGIVLGMSPTGKAEEATNTLITNVIYVMPYLTERLNENYWLDVKFISVYTKHNRNDTYDSTRLSIQELFVKALKGNSKSKSALGEKSHPPEYTLLKATRIITPNYLDRAIWWFAYIESSKLQPYYPSSE